MVGIESIHSPYNIIGREKELDVLKALFQQVSQGRGSTIFISGREGVGKTRLVEAFVKEIMSLEGKGLIGACHPDMHVKYGPFITALKPVGLDHLFLLESPRIESVYLMTDAGLLVSKVEGSHFSVDADIFASMLSAISNFVKDSLAKEKTEEKSLNIMGYGEYRIVVEKGNGLNLVVVHTGKENRNLVGEMHRVLEEIEEKFLLYLSNWKGEIDRFQGAEPLLKRLLTSPKYDGRQLREERLKREYVFDSVRTSLVGLTKEATLVLVLEDLHFADNWSLALLHYLARSCRDDKLMIVGTYTPVTEGNKGHSVVEAMQLMDFDETYNHIHLSPLGLGDIQPFVLSALGNAEFSESFYSKLHIESEGLPYYILMLLRLFSEEGIIQRKEEGWVVAGDIEGINKPSTWLRFLLRSPKFKTLG